MHKNKNLCQAFAVFVTSFGLLLTAINVQAEVRLDITRGSVKALPIAITEFYGIIQGEKEVGTNISRVVSANLARSGLFRDA